jgi:hypothetical protein
MELKPGSRWKGVGGAEFVVVRPPKQVESLQSGGHPVQAAEAVDAALQPEADLSDVLAVGKRYSDDASGLELLVSKAGKGTLTVDGRVMGLKETKALPASD